MEREKEGSMQGNEKRVEVTGGGVGRGPNRFCRRSVLVKLCIGGRNRGMGKGSGGTIGEGGGIAAAMKVLTL